MIITLKDTTSANIASTLVNVREEGGVVALGRVLTLVVLAEDASRAEEAIELSNHASREHPARVIVIDNEATEPGEKGFLDAEIRVGADAGASEVILLRPHGDAGAFPDTLITPLLLPDTPIVALWMGVAPADPSRHPVGQMAGRRITDTTNCHDSRRALLDLAKSYQPGDTDLAWARITLWRALLASELDGQTDLVRSIEVQGTLSRPSTTLLASWLNGALDVPVTTADSSANAIEAVTVNFADGGVLSITRPENSSAATISRTGRRDQVMNLPVRTLSDCLMEDLRRLDADVTYAAALHQVDRWANGNSK